MRHDTAAGRMRLVISLAVVSAAAVLLGLILVAMSTAAHVVSTRPASHVTVLGLVLAAAGIAVGLVTLLVAALTRVGGGSRRAGADRRHAATHQHRAGTSHGQDRDGVRGSAAERSSGQPVHEGFGTPAPANASRGGHRGDMASADRMGRPPPRSDHQPAAYAAGPGWAPPPAQATRQPRQPQQTQTQQSQRTQQSIGSPSDRMRSREAPPPRLAPQPRQAPLREPPPREAPFPREAFPREARLPREARAPRATPPPRPSAMPGHSSRPGASMPSPSAFPGYPRRSGQGPGSASGRGPAGPGYASPAGPWPSPAGGRPAPTAAGAGGTFDGGYAQVIRATDDPARRSSPNRPPDPRRPAGPVGPASPAPADADVFVYRDPSAPPGAPPIGPAADSPARDPAEHDTAYWYDLLAEDTAPRREESRGPFEPWQSSTGTSPGSAGTAPAGTAPAGTAPAGTAPGQAPADDTAQARARKLEQLKDLYLTAEAIGEENVDKHFDQILAQQRELISDYFRQPSARPDATGPQAGHPEGAGVAAEQPRAW